ncbi:hypothetical protein NWI01_33860 [Nitrobacter winogradskyi]|uniref:Uncharacterized protein n=1 Tax=Nitrobacter winogradskyi TaxID=913 RepID=A0A4Y3WF30_NITWI|nr:hypothetical protein NWI01_33860 [Nitrobacter winogradskyi]
MMGVIDQTPYLLWPFKDLARVKSNPKRVIGPNANATSSTARAQNRDDPFIGIVRTRVS